MSLAPPPIVLSPLPVDAPKSASISLLPFGIAYDGVAKISSFFATRPRPPTRATRAAAGTAFSAIDVVSDDAIGPLEAAFRGRLLLSTPIPLPAGYIGLVYTTITPVRTHMLAKMLDGKGKRRGTERENWNGAHDETRPTKRVKVRGSEDRAYAAGSDVERKGGPVMSNPDGRRRSPRKHKAQVAVQKYSMDSDEDVEAEDAGRPEDDKDYIERPTDVIIVVNEYEEPVAVNESAFVVVEGGAAIELTEEEIGADDAMPSAGDGPITDEVVPSTPPAHSQDTAQEIFEDEPLARDIQYIRPSSSFSSLQIWNPDIELDIEENVYAKTLLEWARISDKVGKTFASRSENCLFVCP